MVPSYMQVLHNKFKSYFSQIIQVLLYFSSSTLVANQSRSSSHGLDETSKQLIVETRAPIPAKPGQPARHDYEYERNGVANLFMMFAPLEGWRHVKATDHHAAVRAGAEGTVGPAFSRRRQNRPGPRQSQHPHDRLADAFPTSQLWKKKSPLGSA